MNIPIIYEDDWLQVVNKPSGLLVIPTPRNEKRTLTSILGIHPCHRLDRETSGLIIYAKGKSAQKLMMDEFKQKRVRKTYVAIVQGNLAKNEGRITYPIENRSAVTNYKVIRRGKDFTLVEVMPLTGRTNQIRIHFKNIGHPIVGETVFAFRKDFKLKAKRLCLHAKELEFTHPITKAKIHLDAGLDSFLQEFLNTH
ncbi:MAG: hypothetical protein A3K83_05770 [Omnitrophica WOR_2 bacterium RBG_13_44_8b]|nr:MAG: hypothetical protein A3K83_05770 [Omnitrophica WOR_2 bacterium RBG_13_44_8b]